MIEALRNAFRLPDLRRKILITLGILVIYRLAAHIPVPGTDPVALKRIFEQNSLLGLLNMLSGGAMQNFSVMAMGVYPYITASIIIQLLIPIIPAWSETMKEGDAGRRKMNQWTLWLTIPLALSAGLWADGHPGPARRHAGGGCHLQVRHHNVSAANRGDSGFAHGRHHVGHLVGADHHRGGHRQRCLDHHLRWDRGCRCRRTSSGPGCRAASSSCSCSSS